MYAAPDRVMVIAYSGVTTFQIPHACYYTTAAIPVSPTRTGDCCSKVVFLKNKSDGGHHRFCFSL
jgi:hypothetical protein